MSRKHYIAAAAIIKRRLDWILKTGGRALTTADHAALATLEVVALDMAVMFAADNSRFSRDRFFRAAGFPELADN